MLKFPDESSERAVAGEPHGVVARWFSGNPAISPLETGGFSGSPLFLVQPAGHCPHVLKVFAEGTSRSRAEWVHRVVCHVGTLDAGGLIPPPRTSIDGSSVGTSADGRLWEMVPLVDGVAVAAPSRSQVVAAMHAVARLHGALAAVPWDAPRLAESRGLSERVDRARLLLERPWKQRLDSAPRANPWTDTVRPLLALACGAFDAHQGRLALERLASFSAEPMPCQVVVRDLWSDHVLFDCSTTDHVVGIVDLHAMQIDTPATDVARLLGSWLPSCPSVDATWWDWAIDAYETVRPLGEPGRRLVPLLAANGIVFGLDNWFHWTLEEGRTFRDASQVLSRIQWLGTRLPTALRVLRDG